MVLLKGLGYADNSIVLLTTSAVPGDATLAAILVAGLAETNGNTVTVVPALHPFASVTV